MRRHHLEILVLSVAALFLEMLIIRWLSSEIRIFAYFKNLPLMAAYLGFGIGFSQSSRAGLLRPWFLRLLVALVALIGLAHGLGLTFVVFTDPRQFGLLGAAFGDHAESSSRSLLQTLWALTVMGGMFALVVATFACLTASLGAVFEREQPLHAYSINLVGSVLGILLFSLCSALRWSPAVWLLLFLVLVAYLYRDQWKKSLVYGLLTVGVGLVAEVANPTIWSPYYRITVDEVVERGYRWLVLDVNYDGFQAIRDLSPAGLQGQPAEVVAIAQAHYNIPYELSRRPVENVLVLGGGSQRRSTGSRPAMEQLRVVGRGSTEGL